MLKFRFLMKSMINLSKNLEISRLLINVNRSLNLSSTFSKLKKFHADGVVTLLSVQEKTHHLCGIAIGGMVNVHKEERGNAGIINEFVTEVFSAGPKFFSLRVLDLSETNIDHKLLSSIESRLENLTQLKIRNCPQMDLPILNKLGQFKHITKNLELLDLSNNQKIHFYATDFNPLKRTLSELLKKCPKFKYLIIKNCEMDSYFKELLEASLDSNKKFSSSLEIVYE